MPKYFKIINFNPSFSSDYKDNLEYLSINSGDTGLTYSEPGPTHQYVGYGSFGIHLDDYFRNRMRETPAGGSENLSAFFITEIGMTQMSDFGMTATKEYLYAQFGVSGDSTGYGLLDFRGSTSFNILIGDGIIGPSNTQSTSFEQTKNAAVKILDYLSSNIPNMKWSYVGLPYLPQILTYAPDSGEDFGWYGGVTNTGLSASNYWDSDHPTIGGASLRFFNWISAPDDLKEFYRKKARNSLSEILDASDWMCPDITPVISDNGIFSKTYSIRNKADHTKELLNICTDYQSYVLNENAYTINSRVEIFPYITSLYRSRDNIGDFDSKSGKFTNPYNYVMGSEDIIRTHSGYTASHINETEIYINEAMFKGGMVTPAARSFCDGYVYFDQIPFAIRNACYGIDTETTPLVEDLVGFPLTGGNAEYVVPAGVFYTGIVDAVGNTSDIFLGTTSANVPAVGTTFGFYSSQLNQNNLIFVGRSVALDFDPYGLTSSTFQIYFQTDTSLTGNFNIGLDSLTGYISISGDSLNLQVVSGITWSASDFRSYGLTAGQKRIIFNSDVQTSSLRARNFIDSEVYGYKNLDSQYSTLLDNQRYYNTKTEILAYLSSNHAARTLKYISEAIPVGSSEWPVLYDNLSGTGDGSSFSITGFNSVFWDGDHSIQQPQSYGSALGGDICCLPQTELCCETDEFGCSICTSVPVGQCNGSIVENCSSCARDTDDDIGYCFLNDNCFQSQRCECLRQNGIFYEGTCDCNDDPANCGGGYGKCYCDTNHCTNDDCSFLECFSVSSYTLCSSWTDCSGLNRPGWECTTFSFVESLCCLSCPNGSISCGSSCTREREAENCSGGSYIRIIGNQRCNGSTDSCSSGGSVDCCDTQNCQVDCNVTPLNTGDTPPNSNETQPPDSGIPLTYSPQIGQTALEYIFDPNISDENKMNLIEALTKFTGRNIIKGLERLMYRADLYPINKKRVLGRLANNLDYYNSLPINYSDIECDYNLAQVVRPENLSFMNKFKNFLLTKDKFTDPYQIVRLEGTDDKINSLKSVYGNIGIHPNVVVPPY